MIMTSIIVIYYLYPVALPNDDACCAVARCRIWDFLPLVYVWGYFDEIDIAIGLLPHIGRFRQCHLTHVEESAFYNHYFVFFSEV